MSYITIAELRKPPFSISEKELDKDNAQFLLDTTKDLIDRSCRQKFDKIGESGKEVERTFDGKGSQVLHLNIRLVELKEVKVFVTATTFDLHPSTDFKITSRYIQFIDIRDSFSVRFRPGNFPKGITNIVLVGVFGYATPPTEIKYLQGKLVRKGVDTGSFAERKTNESIGNYKFSLIEMQESFTNDPEFDKIIRRHQNFVMAGA